MKQHLQQLRAAAEGAGYHLRNADGRDMIRARGLDGAVEYILGVGALMARADAVFNCVLKQEDAGKRLDDHAGDFQAAADELARLLGPREDRVMLQARRQLERRYYNRDARQRHSLFISRTSDGPLGHQASMLLAAAADAGLADPGPDGYRDKLAQIVSSEIEKRYPRREGFTTALEGSAHLARIRAAEREEEAAKAMVLGRLPTLERKLDALGSKWVTRESAKVLNQIRKRLALRAIEGWVPDVMRYEREVSSHVMEETRSILHRAS
jgi:hypothetical protein